MRRTAWTCEIYCAMAFMVHMVHNVGDICMVCVQNVYRLFCSYMCYIVSAFFILHLLSYLSYLICPDARRERQFAPKTNPKELLKLFRILYKNKPRFRDGQFTQVGDVIDFVIDENGHRTGKVVEATHSVFGEVVVKMCRVTPMTPNKPLERLRREVLFLRRMHNCNHIVQVLGSTCATEGKVDRRHLVTIVFEKMTGTIEQALEALPKSERRMPEEQVLYMARDILTGLHIMHTTNDVDCPSLHLDIKPANIGNVCCLIICHRITAH